MATATATLSPHSNHHVGIPLVAIWTTWASSPRGKRKRKRDYLYGDILLAKIGNEITVSNGNQRRTRGDP